MPFASSAGFADDDYLEEIEGNLLEVYEQQYENSPVKARRQFTWNVLRHFRPAFIKSFKLFQPSNHRAMLRHNFILAFRNFQRYKSTFLINLIGLSSGLACALLIYLWVNDELSMDKFHENDSQLYQILENVQQAGDTITRQTTAGPTAEALAEEMPEVALAATATVARITDATLSVDNDDLKAKGIYASANYFKLFSYDLIRGDEDQVLFDKKSIVVSKSLAQNLFGTTEDVIGKMVEWQHDKQFQISGVFSDMPQAVFSSI